MHTRPRIAITLGDPGGVGPETIVAAWSNEAMHGCCRPFVVGRPEVLWRAVKLWNTSAEVIPIGLLSQAEPSPGVIPCLVAGPEDSAEVRPGTIDARTGQAAYDAVVAATRLALDGQIDAIVTAPLHKEALHLAGHHYPGHTELLAELCGIRDFAMMLYLAPGEPVRAPAGLAVVHVTLHTALRNVFDQLTTEAVLAKIRLAHRFMLRVKGSQPCIGTAALNPHGGEGGLFGREESEVIRPAVEQARQDGIDVDGPLPTDTLMIKARDGLYDAVVAMYHDQGHIALKLLGMHRAVNITLGLPIIRTSVAHGTAFDIAWKREANPNSLLEAVRIAARLAATAS